MGVASPSVLPAAATADDSPHPTYTKMITEALTELGGTFGHAAIAGCILCCFTGLPTTHDVLLSAHLRRLVSECVIHSFASTHVFPTLARPRKDSLAASVTKNSLDLNLDPSRGLQASIDDGDSSTNDDEDDYTGDDDDDEYTPVCAAYMLGMKCDRGRVSRAAPTVATHDTSTTKRVRGRPRKEPEAMSMSIMRGPGRLRKEAFPFPMSASVTKPKKLLDLNLDPSQGLQISSDDYVDVYSGDDDDVNYSPMLGAKRGRGCPWKRGRGWPRKVVLSANRGGASSPLTKRGRGRPRKRQNVFPSEASFQNGGDTTPMQTLRGDFSMPKSGRGRPRKEIEETSVSIKRGRGRLRKHEQSQADSSPIGSKKSEISGSKGSSE